MRCWSRRQNLLLLWSVWALVLPLVSPFPVPYVGPFVPLIMGSIPDPILHVSVGTAASGLGSLAALPVEVLLKEEENSQENRGMFDRTYSSIQQGLQLGVYSVLLAGSVASSFRW